MLTKSTTISRSVRVGKFTGPGFLNITTARGDIKMYHGDHLVEVDYTRDTRPGEAGYPDAVVKKTSVFVVSEDCAKGLGIFLEKSIEEEQNLAALDDERALAEPSKKPADASPASSASTPPSSTATSTGIGGASTGQATSK